MSQKPDSKLRLAQRLQHGLVEPTAPAVWADCYILEFSPADTRGDVSTTTFNAVTATETGIQTAAGT